MGGEEREDVMDGGRKGEREKRERRKREGRKGANGKEWQAVNLCIYTNVHMSTYLEQWLRSRLVFQQS